MSAKSSMQCENSKLKGKQAKKREEKSRRNFPDSDEDNFSLDMHRKIWEGQSFYSISKELSEKANLNGLRMLNRISDELLKFEKNITESTKHATITFIKEPVYLPNLLEFEKYRRSYGEWADRWHVISNNMSSQKNSKEISILIEKGWNPLAFVDLIEYRGHSLQDITDEIEKEKYLKGIQRLYRKTPSTKN